MVLLVGALLMAVAGFNWLRGPEGNAWIRVTAERQISALTDGGTLRIGDLRTDLVGELRLEGVVMSDRDGRAVLTVPAAELHFTPVIFGPRRALVVEELRLQAPEVDLPGLLALFPPSEGGGPAQALPFDIYVGLVRIEDGRLSYGDPLRLVDLDAALAGRVLGTTIFVDRLGLSTQAQAPALGPVRGEGSLEVDFDGALRVGGLRVESAALAGRLAGSLQGEALDVELAAARVDLDALEGLTGDLGLKGVVGADLTLEGPLSALVVRGDLKAPAGVAAVDLTLDVSGPEPAYKGELRPEGLDLGTLLDAVTEPTVLNGRLSVDGSGSAWPDGIRASGEVELADAVGWGYAVPGAKASYVLEKGVFKLTGLHYEAWWGVVDGAGVLTPKSMDLDLEAQVFDARGLAEFGALGLLGRGRASGRLQADWSTERLWVEFKGPVLAFDAAYADLAQVGRLEGPVRVVVDGDRVQAASVVPTEALRVSSNGVTVAAASASWTAVVVGDALAWSAELEGEAADAFGATLDGFSGVAAGAGEVTSAWLTLGPGRYDRFAADDGAAEVALVGDRLRMRVHLRSAGEPVVVVAGVGDLAGGAWILDEVQVGRDSGVAWVNEGPQRFTLVEGGAEAIDLRMSSSGGRVELQGRLAEVGALQARVKVEDFLLQNLALLFPAEAAGVVGRVGADVEVSGTLELPVAVGRVRAEGLTIPDLLWGVVAELEVDAEGERVQAAGQLSDGGGELLHLEGALPVDVRGGRPRPVLAAAAEGHVVVHRVALARLSAAIPALGQLGEGEVAAEGELSGTLGSPSIHGRFGLYAPVGAEQRWMRLDGDLHLDGEVMELRATGHERGHELLQVVGGGHSGLPQLIAALADPEIADPDLANPRTYVDSIDLSVLPQQVPLQTARAFVEIPGDIQGEVSGGVRVSGDPLRPQISGGLQLTQGKIGALFLSPAILALSAEEQGLRLTVFAGFAEAEATAGEHQVTVGGFLPFRLVLEEGFDLDAELAREGLDLQVDGELPLAVLSAFDASVEKASGLLRIGGEVGGSLAKPTPDLDLELDQGGFIYRSLGVEFERLSLRAALKGEDLRLYSARFSSRPLVPPVSLPEFGKAQAMTCAASLEPGDTLTAGRARLEGVELKDLDLRVCSRKGWFSATPDMSVQVSTDMAVTGDWPNLRVTGPVVVDRAEMAFGEDFFFDESTLALDPALEVVRSAAPVIVGAVEEGEFYDPWTFDLDVDLNRSTRLSAVVPMLDAYDALQLSSIGLENGELDGQVHVVMHGPDLDIGGEVEVLRGVVQVMNQDFDLQEGTIVFAGSAWDDPALDLRATRVAGSYGLIEVLVGQTALQPSLEFKSDNDYTTTDIMSILLFGAPTSELTSAQGAGASGIGGLLLNQVGGVIGNEIQTAGSSVQLVDTIAVGAAGEDSTLRLGWHVGNRGYLEYQVNPGAAAAEDEAVNTLTLEFVLARRLQAEATVSDKGSDGQAVSAEIVKSWRF